MSAEPQISVIVPVRDGDQQLPKLFDALERQTVGRMAFEVVVADNASRDRSADVARERGATVVEVPRPGRARARNRAVQLARAPLLAFTDADCLPEADWLEALVGCLERFPLAGGPVRLSTGDPPSPLQRLETLWRFPQEMTIESEGWSVTANLGMTREAFDAVGGFDESFRHIGEDVDICLRARRAGFRIVWCAGAVVEHPAESRLVTAVRRGAATAHSEYQLHLVHGRHEGAHWRHPGPLVRGDFALRHFGIDPDDLPAGERPRVLRVARLEWGGRMYGSLWGRLTLRGPLAALRDRWAR